MKSPDIRARFIRPSLDPQKLHHFLTLYELRTFSAAAAANGVSQQAVSKSIARLEENLGVKLFERGGFGAEPTIFAHTLARRAKVITAESRLAAAELSALRGSDKGYVRIGLGWTFLPRIAPMIITRFKQRQPGVTLSITSGDSKTLFQQLVSGEVEFVASAPPVEMQIDDALITEPLFEDRDVIVMRKDHPLARKAEVTLEDLQAQSWMISLTLSEQWQRICRIFLRAGLNPPQSYVDMNSVILVKSALLQSDSVALLAEELIALGTERDLYHIIPDTDFPIARTAYFTMRRGSQLQPLATKVKTDLVASIRKFIPAADLRGISMPDA